MKIVQIFLFFIINISFISNNNASESKIEYIFSNFSNFKCNASNYITSFTSKICSNTTINSDQTFSFSFSDTKSESHKVQCTINSKNKLRLLQGTDIISIDSDISYTEQPIIPEKNNCYETICEFDGMKKDSFTILINKDFELVIEGLPDNIYLSCYYYENLSYTVDKCYLVKNDFKQVSKYRVNNSTNKMTFLLITSIKAKIEENEKLWVNISLLKNDTKENKNISCTSQYSAEPVDNEEILMFYDCEVPNLKNVSEYNGLIVNFSYDIDNIPKKSDSKNPKKTDELIKNNKVNDYSMITFKSKNLNFSQCEENGEFTLTGEINGMFKEETYFYIIFFLNNNKEEYKMADCKIPKGYREELTITCVTQENFSNSKVEIPLLYLQDDETEDILLAITKISNNKKTTCILNPVIDTTEIIPTTVPTTYIIPTTQVVVETTEIVIEPTIVTTDVVFRQINHLEINNSSKVIKFNIIGFCFYDDNIEKNMVLPINVNLIDNNNKKESTNLNCSLNNIFNSTREKIFDLTFICNIDNLTNVFKYKDVVIINSSSLINIPKENSPLSSALNTNQLITEGLLTDYYDQENMKEIPAIISSTSISADNCQKDGVFEINGFIDKTIEQNLSFYIKLDNPDTSVRCKMNQIEMNSEVEIYCDTFDSINNNIFINSKIIYDINYNELFYLSEINSSSNINCANNDEIKYNKALKKMDSFVVFRQVSKFRKLDNRYSFFLASFIKKEIDLNQKIYINVEIKSASEQKIKSNKQGRLLYFRKLSPREEQTAECSINTKTNISENGLGCAGWVCSSGDSSITDAVGLDIKESEDLTGIPTESYLIDPAQTDALIEEGEATDYSIEENLNILLPLFKTLELNYSMCKQNGTFSFIGTTTATIDKDIVFNFSLSYPDVIFACKLPRTLKDEITEIECYSREEFENYTLLVEETVIRYDNIEYFILRNTSSGDRYVTCSSTYTNITGNSYEEEFRIITRRISNSNSAKLSLTGIILVIVVGVLVLAGGLFLFFFIKCQNKNKDNDKEKDKNATSESKDNKNESTSSFY